MIGYKRNDSGFGFLIFEKFITDPYFLTSQISIVFIPYMHISHGLLANYNKKNEADKNML